MSFIDKGIVKNISKQYGLRTGRDERFFDDLWELAQIGRKYKKQNKNAIKESLQENYIHLAGAILNKSNFNIFRSATSNVGTRQDNTNNVFQRLKTFNLKSRFRAAADTRQGEMGRTERQTSNFVIFSDHHITENTHRHNYMRRWNMELYKEVLNYYADNDFGLIENGDVEEYTIFEPTTRIVNGYNNLIEKKKTAGIKQDVGSIDWNELIQERESNRVEILNNILNDNQDYYDLIDSRFASKGRRYYTKITGNHDPFLSNRLTRLLPTNIRRNLCDGLRINYRDTNYQPIREPKYFITHGHQFDTSTLPQHAFAVGEVFSETLGVFINGADRVWDAAKTSAWRINDSVSFRNILATAKANLTPSPSIGNMMNEVIIELLLHNHEIAWEYFDRRTKASAVKFEVLTGDEYFKVRHLSETDLVSKMDFYNSRTEMRDYQNPTKVIIGHTHEPRMNSRKKRYQQSQAFNYLNTGSAGRFENFIWGVELVDGTEKVISWTKDGQNLVRHQWIPGSNGRFTKADYPL